MPLPLQIDRDSGIPVYVQLEERIRMLLHQGVLRRGQAMPTVRTLAVDLGINANTVTRVYRDLQADGLLRLERGIGTFVAEGADTPMSTSALKHLDKKVGDVIHLARQAGLTPRELSQFIQTRWKES